MSVLLSLDIWILPKASKQSATALTLGYGNRFFRMVLGPTYCVHKLHPLDSMTGNFEETRAREDDGNAARAADRNIEAISAIELADGVVTMSVAQLSYLLFGIDWLMPQATWRPQASG